MKVFITTLTLLLGGIFLTAPVLADDAGDVKAAFLSHFTMLRTHDSQSMAQNYMPDYTNFGRGGGLLIRTATPEEMGKARQAVFDSVNITLQPRNVEVQVYGNAAVVTAYLVGSITPPNGETIRVNDRRTGVWVKQGGKWKEVHMHQSPIRLPQ
jgi:ketosteroid isomerase-like protein